MRLYRAMASEAGEALRKDTDGEGRYGAVHHLDRFAFVAIPDTPCAGSTIYALNAAGVVWKTARVPGYTLRYVALAEGVESTTQLSGSKLPWLEAWDFPADPASAGCTRD